jgi:transposase
VRIIDVFVDSLDMEELGFKNAIPSNTGRPGYDPRVLLKLYIYGHLNKIVASRKLEAETYRNIELMWLLSKLKPDHKSISDFRKDNGEAIKKVFREFVALYKQWDLFGMEVVAVDSTKFRASNSKKQF